MAPIKFEENMKEKLEERTLNPSAKSWDALASRLDEAPAKKKTNRLWFINIAASVVGVLLLVTGIVNYNNEGTTTVVDTETETNTTKEAIKEAIKENTAINKGSILYQDSKNEVIAERTEAAKNTIETEVLKDQFVNRNAQALAHTTRNKQEQSVNTKTGVKTLKEDKNTKEEAVNKNYIASNIRTTLLPETTITEQNIVAAASLENEIIKVTDSELDALLNTAQRDLVKKPLSSPVPLDYNELLQDVEDNIEESFRDKILKTVKGGYRSVKSYVAERND